MKKLQGTSIFEGIVIKKPYYRKKKKSLIKVYKISREMVEKELRRFQVAIDDTKHQIKILLESLSGKINQHDIKILNVHIMMLEDPVYLSDITNKIKIENLNVEAVVESVTKKYSGMFKALNDSVFKQRAIDIEDVGEKLIGNLIGKKNIKENLDNKILVVQDLKPSDLLRYHNEGVNLKGIVTELGGETSHASILAKTLGIPTLMGVNNLTSIDWNENENIILDTRRGQEFVAIKPNDSIIEWYSKELNEWIIFEKELKNLIGVPAVTLDKKRINLNANVGGLSDIEDLEKNKPDGIGLLRTEFIYMEAENFPSEDEQCEIYIKMSQSLGKEKPLIIRTLDIGADKKLSYFDMPEEENPSLGLRAIRLSLQNKRMFKTQLKAILRASKFGNLKIMYPMISMVEELIEANELLEISKKELKDQSIEYDEKIEIGIMVEVPSAVILMDIFSEMVDFFSIGTNDLTQYILAADRLSKEVAHVYDSYNPAVFRMIARTAEVANLNGKKVSVCGEMAGDVLAVIAFLSFGIENLSMLPSLIPKVKKIIKSINTKELEELKKEILTLKTSSEIKTALNDYYLGVI